MNALRTMASLLAVFCIFVFAVPPTLAQEFSAVQNTTRQFELTEVGTSRDRVWLATDLDTGEKNVRIAMSSTDATVHGLPYNLGKVGAIVTFHSWFTFLAAGTIVTDELWVTPPPKQPGKGLVTTRVKAGGLPEQPVRSIGRRGKLASDDHQPLGIQAASFGELKEMVDQGQ